MLFFLKKSQFTIFFFRNKPKSCITKNIYTVQLIIKKYEGGWGDKIHPNVTNLEYAPEVYRGSHKEV